MFADQIIALSIANYRSRVRAVESVTGNRLDRLQFTLRGAALLQTLHMRDASCIGLPFALSIANYDLVMGKACLKLDRYSCGRAFKHAPNH